ncbi:tetratricopeptide repeat protein [Ferruginibacter sp.]
MLKKKYTLSFILLIFSIAVSAQQEDKDFNTADSLIKVNQFEKSIALLDKLISTYGEKEKYLTNRGFAYMQLNDVEKAKLNYERAIALNPGCTKCMGNLGIIESGNNNYEKATGYFNQYIKLEPAKPLGYIKRGEIESQLGQYEAALTDLNKALELDVNSPYIYLWLAITKLSMGDTKAALEDINRSIQIQPNVEYAYFVRSKCYISLGQNQAAWTDLVSCLKKNPTFSEYHTYAGIVLYRLNEFDKASQAFNESIRLDAGSYMAYQQRSYLLFDRGKFEEACSDKATAKALLGKESFENAAVKEITEDINKYCNNSHAGFYLSRGNTLFALGQYEKAGQVLDEGIAKFNNDPSLYNARGNSCIAMGKSRNALDYYATCLVNINKLDETAIITKENPDKKTAKAFFVSELYNSIAYAHANLLNFDSAIINLSQSIKILIDNPSINDQPLILSEYTAKRAAFYSFQEKYDAANKDIAEALRINPQCVTALLNRAVMLLNKNTIEQSKSNNMAAIAPPAAPPPYFFTTTTVKNLNRQEIINAVKDCDEAIKYQPANAMAYLRRAQANIILKNNHYCADISTARSLGVKDAAAMLGVTCTE